MSDLPAQEQPSTRTDADPAEAADHALPAPSNVAQPKLDKASFA